MSMHNRYCSRVYRDINRVTLLAVNQWADHNFSIDVVNPESHFQRAQITVTVFRFTPRVVYLPDDIRITVTDLACPQ